MVNTSRINRIHLNVLEMLLSLDEKTADACFYDFGNRASVMDYSDFRSSYQQMKARGVQPVKKISKIKTAELAILLKLNPKWAETRYTYRIDRIGEEVEREAYCLLYDALRTHEARLDIAPRDEQEALFRLETMLNVSIESADLYYEKYAARIVLKKKYSVLKSEALQRRLAELALKDLEAAERFYRKCAVGLVSKDAYTSIKRRALQYRLRKACEASLEDANALFESSARGIVSQEEYDSIRRPFIVKRLRQLCCANLKEADAFYEQEACSMVSLSEYKEMQKKPLALARLKALCGKDLRAADRFFADQAREVVTPQEYGEIRRPALLEQLKIVCEQNIVAADALFSDCGESAVTPQEYAQIKRPLLIAALTKLYPEDQKSADALYARSAKGIVSVEEYNAIRRPHVLEHLRSICEKSLVDAELFYNSYARKVISEREYANICLPHSLAKLRGLFQTDYMGAVQHYSSQQVQIISEEEFYNEAGKFVSAWFVAQKSQNHFGGNLPDPDQAKAIAMIQGNVLVTARAGSGKTATMIHRAYFMLKHCKIPAERILMLAFNKDAAEEMRRRLNQLLTNDRSMSASALPHIMTFHALAHALVLPEKAILYDEKRGPQTQSRVLQEKIIDVYLEACLKKTGFAQDVRKLMMTYFRVNIDDKRFLPRDEFLKLKRAAVQESLKGDHVKSYGEKRIANFLFEHGVEYSYERSFRWNGRSYRPDFTLPAADSLRKDRGLIIEYLGLQGQPDYDRQTEEKRKYWKARPNWQLIEIVPEDMRREDDEFERWLKGILREHHIRCKKLTEDEIWKRARRHAINAFTSAMRNFIQRCRRSCISPDDLHSRIQEFSDGSDDELLFAKLAERFYRSYLRRVRATGQDDFDGLMLNAIDKARAGETAFQRKDSHGDLAKIEYIAIDEYQDFSELFYQLVAAIRQINPNINLYCVGDDWQAINGFAGSDLRFFRHFDDYFGSSVHIELLNNYRSNGAIVAVGNALMRGLGTPGRVAPSAHHETGKVYICYTEDFSPTKQEKEKYGHDHLSPIVRRILFAQQKRNHSVALLDRRSMISRDISSGEGELSERSRELSVLKDNMKSLFPEADLVSSTVHSFKGLEKDAVILLDAGEDCFPLIHPNWRFSRIIGESIEEIVSAERRLLYVALTRAKCDLYLLTERQSASCFLRLILGKAQLVPMDWREYPSDLNSNLLSIEVGNQPERGIAPTCDIRELLKRAGFLWSSGQKAWIKHVERSAYDPTLLQQEDWYAGADGVVVNVYDANRDLIDMFTT